MSHDCAQLWFLKAPTHVCHLDPLTETSQVSRAGGSWRQSQGFLHQNILALGILLRSRQWGVCVQWMLGMRSCPQTVAGPQRWWNVWAVCFLSLKFLQPVFSVSWSHSALTSHSGSPIRRSFQTISFYILDFHFTPILKTLKASLALLILDVQHALPFPGTVSSCPELPLTLLCWLSPPLPFNSLSGIIFQDCLSEPPPLLQAHICFHSTTYTIPLLPDCSGVSHLDWEFTGGRRHTCQLQLDPSPQTTAL